LKGLGNVPRGLHNDLFAYGTLMSRDIMQTVSGQRCEATSGILRGYRRNRIRGKVYPGIIASPGAMVEGILYSGLAKDAWKRLDFFEGKMYYRWSVAVQNEDGTVREAETYVLRPQFEYRLTPEPWDLDEFLRWGKAQFESQYRGFAAVFKEEIYGRSSRKHQGD
jgi:gamma-glutamylcyclotransferase (GGCT)/AIG2-like uncharacterized protein YtfP